MPYSSKQHRLFEAAAHDTKIAKKVSIPQATAKKLASEGVKHSPQQLASALMRK